MVDVDSMAVHDRIPSYLLPVDQQKRRHRSRDIGEELLQHLEQVVILVRRTKRSALLRSLIEKVCGVQVYLEGRSDDAEGSVPLPVRNALFMQLASLPSSSQRDLQRAAERILLLASDEFGVQAVKEMLDPGSPADASVLAPPTDKLSQAIYLYLCQEFPDALRDPRFDHAEVRQEMLRERLNRRYSSHYVGPKDVQPKLGPEMDTLLLDRLYALFPEVDKDNMLVEIFLRRERNEPDAPIVLYTLRASFNGSHVHYRKVQGGEMIDHDDAAVTCVEFAWQPGKGTLSVYCEDKEVRPELTKVFRDVVLGGNGEIGAMPMREFDLTGFSSPAMLDRIRRERRDGIDSITIQEVVIAKPRICSAVVRGKPINRVAYSDFRIRKHRYDSRDIYAIAGDDGHFDDLTAYEIVRVKIAMQVGRTAFRRSHPVTVEITAPNGFSDRSKTEEDAELVFGQLERLGCAWQY